MPVPNGSVWDRIAEHPTMGSHSSQQYSPERSARCATGRIEPGDGSQHDPGTPSASVGFAPGLEHVVELPGLDLVHLSSSHPAAVAGGVLPGRLLSAVPASEPAHRIDLAWQSGLPNHEPAHAGAHEAF